jgi:hypothetical protein
VVNVGNNLIPMLNEFYENDAIFDKYQTAFSPDGNSILTGGYNNQFSTIRVDGSTIGNFELPSINFNLDMNSGKNGIQQINKRMRGIF